MKRSVVKWITGVVAAVGLGLFVGCGNIATEENSAKERDITPYASETELNAYADKGFVHYKVARYYALGALENFQDSDEFKGGELSEYPVIIYQAQTEEPRYYEFKVLKDNQPVAGIACVATRDEGLPVKYVLPYSKEIETSEARAVSAGNAKIIDTGYPSKLSVRNGNTSRNATDDDIESDVSILDALETFDDTQLAELGLTDKETQAAVKADIEAENQEIAAIWKQIDEVTENIVNLTDEELAEIYFSDEAAARKLIYNDHRTESDFALENPWKTKKTWWQPSGIYCGPSTIAFIMLNLGQDECPGYRPIPAVANSAQLDSYYRDVENKVGKGPKLFGSLSSKLSTYTNGKYTLESCSHSPSTILSHMQNEQLPCVSLRCSRSWSHMAFHYRTVIGMRTEKVRTILKIFGRKKTLCSWHDYFYLMHDNSTDGENFYENSKKLYEIGAAKLVKNY